MEFTDLYTDVLNIIFGLLKLRTKGKLRQTCTKFSLLPIRSLTIRGGERIPDSVWLTLHSVIITEWRSKEIIIPPAPFLTSLDLTYKDYVVTPGLYETRPSVQLSNVPQLRSIKCNLKVKEIKNMYKLENYIGLYHKDIADLNRTTRLNSLTFLNGGPMTPSVSSPLKVLNIRDDMKLININKFDQFMGLETLKLPFITFSNIKYNHSIPDIIPTLKHLKIRGPLAPYGGLKIDNSGMCAPTQFTTLTSLHICRLQPIDYLHLTQLTWLVINSCSSFLLGTEIGSLKRLTHLGLRVDTVLIDNLPQSLIHLNIKCNNGVIIDHLTNLETLSISNQRDNRIINSLPKLTILEHRGPIDCHPNLIPNLMYYINTSVDPKDINTGILMKGVSRITLSCYDSKLYTKAEKIIIDDHDNESCGNIDIGNLDCRKLDINIYTIYCRETEIDKSCRFINYKNIKKIRTYDRSVVDGMHKSHTFVNERGLEVQVWRK